MDSLCLSFFRIFQGYCSVFVLCAGVRGFLGYLRLKVESERFQILELESGSESARLEMFELESGFE